MRICFVFVLLLISGVVYGQSTTSAWSTSAPKPETSRTEKAAPGQSTPGASRVGLIDSRAFYDEKAGIARVVAAYRTLEKEFAGRKDELAQLQARLSAASDELKKLNAGLRATPDVLAGRKDEVDRLQREFEFKRDEAKSAYVKRERDVIAPLFAEVGKALEQFMKEQNVSVVIDSAKIGEALLAALPSADLTNAFISDFNRRYPAESSIASSR